MPAAPLFAADLRDALALRPAALALNALHEAETSPLDAAGLDALCAAAFAAPALSDASGRLLGFLIAFGERAAYASPNYRWVSAALRRFAYVDRVIVAPEARGLGLGRALYAAVEAQAGAAGLDWLCSEVNSAPPNPGSDAFHAALGFTAFGAASLPNGKSVRYLRRRL